jgi:two-component system CheB/CheR fusion protein
MAETLPDPHETFPIVGVGASAGGIEAFTELLRAMPDLPGMAFVFVLHQDPTHTSNLPQVIARVSPMPVKQIEDRMPVETNTVYVAPGNAELSIEDGNLRLYERMSGTALIDSFFRTLAEDQGTRAISVVLSGSASDGALGTREIKAEGGITFAQDETAKVGGMPQAAVAAGFVDFVLSARGIAEELLRIARQDYVRASTRTLLPEPDLRKLFALIHSKHDIDFTHYKPTTIERRIRRRMALRRVNSLNAYLKIVRDESEEIEQLYADILIKVTGFFRDPEVFAALERDVLPELVRERGENGGLRAWVPGCATGEEVYSLAISMLEAVGNANLSCPIQVFGTDVSEAAIERARAGVYPDTIASEVSPERLRRFFTKVAGGYRINKAVRDSCVFARQDVTKDPPFSKIDLISCRNLMIYLGMALQRKVISIFSYALRPDGFLLLGSSESIGNLSDLFAIVDRRHKIYRKTATGRVFVEFGIAKTLPRTERIETEHEGPPNVVFREADRVLLTRFSPSGVLINEALEVLQFRGRTSRYLELPTGTANFNLLKMAREGLLADLSSAIHGAMRQDKPQRREGLEIKDADHTAIVNIEVIPFVGVSKERFMIVLFEEQPAEKRPRKAKKEAATPQLARLKRELQATREYLQSHVEEQETMNEELRSANEEIQSTNEEMQSTNEELETAKEELQSSNEELTTLNEELQTRNQELALANNDLVNLLTSIEIPILMLDAKLCIRRFNPIAQRKLNLVAADIGRPVGDINTKLALDGLEEMIQEVIDTLEVKEVEVRHRDGRMQSLRIRPYLTTDRRIDGAVLALIDLEEFRKGKLGPG